MPGLREMRLERAKKFVLLYPDASKEDQAKAADVSTSTIATARKILVSEGKLQMSRKGVIPARPEPDLAPWRPNEIAEPPGGTRPAEGTPQVAPPSRVASDMKTHDEMVRLAEMLESGDLNDETVEKNFLKQCIRWAMDPNLHPDTRMSAQQMWHKLKDKKNSAALGPGIPLTREDALKRLGDVLKACGPKMVLEAIDLVFDKKEPNGQTSDEGATPGGSAPAPATA